MTENRKRVTEEGRQGELKVEFGMRKVEIKAEGNEGGI